MSLTDHLLLGGILLALAGAICVCVRNHRKGGGCCGGCTHCDRSCGEQNHK